MSNVAEYPMSDVATMPAVQWGDFTPNAVEYGQRPPYSAVVLGALVRTVDNHFGSVRIAELGAGTGNLLRSFPEKNLSGYAVEPNKAMRSVAHKLAPDDNRFEWINGTAEASGLPAKSVNWVLLGNAYQFVDPAAMFREAHRILVDQGFLTIIWNVRDFKRDPIQRDIEEMVKREVPNLKRTGTSVAEIMEAMDTGGLFRDYIYAEARHDQQFSRDRFLATWKAGHDVPSQVSSAQWDALLAKTARMISHLDTIATIWNTRAWTLQASQS
jgi:ubiquinone/menaquinone biosynthesis C-methylase UbiE